MTSKKQQPVDKEPKQRFEGTNKGTAKKAPMQKKKPHKLTRAEYDDLRQIDWVPFDPYSI